FGFTTGKSKSMYGREGHMGTRFVKFASDPSGLKDDMRLADFLRNRSTGALLGLQYSPRSDQGKMTRKIPTDPNFVKLDKRTREIFRNCVEGVDFDTRKKVTIDNEREKAQPH
nr:hypothetical protein [Tanacetum cinerariifolium]